MWHSVLCNERQEKRVGCKNGDPCYTVAKYLLKLFTTLTWKANQDEPRAPGKPLERNRMLACVRVVFLAAYKLLLEKYDPWQ